MEPKRRRTIVVLVLLLGSLTATGRLARISEIRAVDMLLLVSTGILIGVLLTTLFSRTRQG